MSILAVLCGVAAGLVVTAMPWFELPKKPDMSGVLERVFLKELLKGGEMDTEQRQVDREVEAEVKKRRRGGVMVDGVFRKRTSPPSLKLGLGSKWNSAKKEL